MRYWIFEGDHSDLERFSSQGWYVMLETVEFVGVGRIRCLLRNQP